MTQNLEGDSLERVFPFNFAFDASLKLIRIGRSLKKIIKIDHLNEPITNVMKLIQPFIQLSVEELHLNLDKEFIFSILENEILLKGELIFDVESGIYTFLGGPWVSNLGQVVELGLQSKDFAIHDRSLHYFNVIQQHQKALNEAQNLAEKLTLQGKELKQKEEQLSMALEGGQDGIWDWRLDTNDFYYSPRFVEMLGYQYEEIRPNFNSIEKLIHDEDSLRFEGILANHLRYGEPFDIECRWKTKSGSWKWILTRGKAVEWKEDGSPLRMVGLNSNIDERKKSEEELRSVHVRLIDAIEILDSGFAIFDKNERLVVCNSKYREMYHEAAEQLTHGTSYDLILDALCKSGVPEKSGADPHKWIAHKLAFHRRPGIDREEKLKDMWVRSSERRTSEGGIVTLLTDITERIQAEDDLKKYAEIVQSTYEGILSFDLQGVITSWNPACYEIFGYTPQEAVGQHLSMMFPDDLMHEMSQFLTSLRLKASIERYETARVKKDGNTVYISQTISPILDKKEHVMGASMVVQDITDKKKIEMEMIKRDLLMQGINQASHDLLTEEDYFKGMELAIASVGEALKADCVSVQFNSKGSKRHVWNKGVKNVEDLVIIPEKWKKNLQNGELINQHGGFSEEEKHFFVLPRAESILIFPLDVGNQFLGFISIEVADQQRTWLDNEIALLNAFSYAVAGSFAKEAAEQQLALAREKEVEIGFRIQHALLFGKPPENLKGITIALVTIASQGIDGDFYDFFSHNHHEFDLLIGDVMGKGIPAALLGAATKGAFNHAITTLTTSTKGRLPDPKEILTFVHERITAQMIELESFMTICFARFNDEIKEMTFVDCGHTNTLHFKRKEKRVDLLRGHNVPLGFLEKEVYLQDTIKYELGDIFLFYSDGLTEARGKTSEFFGIERLKSILINEYHQPADKIVKTITKAVEHFSEALVFQDDLTVIVVKFEEEGLQIEFSETIQLPKRLDDLEIVRRSIVKFCLKASRNIEPLKLIELELASNEVFTNIVRHVSGTEANMIELIFEMYSDRVRIHFDYLGQKFEPHSFELPAYEQAPAGGFGLYIIQMMVDEVVYQTIDGDKQRITLTKYL